MAVSRVDEDRELAQQSASKVRLVASIRSIFSIAAATPSVRQWHCGCCGAAGLPSWRVCALRHVVTT
eukprot:4431244-Prymnesium_polylepis.1